LGGKHAAAFASQVSEALARITSFGAAVDFAMLPVIGSLSDAFGRRPLLLALPLMALCLRIGAVLSPTTPVLVASKMLMGAIVSCELSHCPQPPPCANHRAGRSCLQK
jgi:MFS family permease